MRMTFLALAPLLTAGLFTIAPASAVTTVTGAVLPTSRAVQVGTLATAFASVINTGAETATNCGLALASPVNADFIYRTTDPLTNVPITPEAQRADIPPGARQTWVFGLIPRGPFAPTQVQLEMDCANSAPAPIYPGVNTLLLSASSSPGPDIIAFGATLSGDGVARSPGTAATALFAVAISNVGASANLRVDADLVGSYAGAQAFVCQTNPATGACSTAVLPELTAFVAGGADATFAIFVPASGRVPFDPASTRVNVNFFEASSGILKGSTSVAFTTQTELASGGGELAFEGTTVSLSSDDAWAPVDVSVDPRAGTPAPLPSGFTEPRQTTNVSVSDETRLNSPLVMTFDFLSRAGVPVVLHYDTDSGTWEPTTVRAIDRAGGKITVDSRTFSDFTLTEIAEFLPEAYTIPRFDPEASGWNIANFEGAYLTPGGNCLGMAAYAQWFFLHRLSENLVDKFSNAGGAPTSIAHLTASRAHLAQSQYWTNRFTETEQGMGDRDLGILMKALIFLFRQPLILHLKSSSAAHANVVYGYDAGGFYIYEVNYAPGAEERVRYLPFDGTNFGTYGAYDTFGYVASPSLGRSEDFAALTADAEGGFPGSALVNFTSPTQGQMVAARGVDLSGTLTGDLRNADDVAAYVNGKLYRIGNSSGSFYRFVPVRFGTNTIILVAGNFIANQSRWYRNGATIVRTFEGTLPSATFRATLTWDKSGDVDLYVTEPGGETAWYSNKTTSHGLTLDFDNTSGYGPENTTLSKGAGGTVLTDGTYDVRVHYYRGTAPVSGKVDLLLYEGKPNQILQSIDWTISAAGSSATKGPGASGPQWYGIAEIGLSDD